MKARPPKDKSKLRTGFTTGACAAAAAQAAARLLVRGAELRAIETTLPNRERHSFQLETLRETRPGLAEASVIKDAGDDPDCTDKAHLSVRLELARPAGIELKAGPGVATVRKPGLGLELGRPAITAVPERSLVELVQAELAGSGWAGARIELFVPGGEEMAKETLNARLGLEGGISILGTTGIVKPYSTSAYRASVVRAVDLAAALECKTLVLTTGGRTEESAMRLLPALSEHAFIQVGDFIGTGLAHAARRGIARVYIVGMIGKLAKMAAGVMMTHAAGSRVDMGLLARFAGEAGASSALVSEVAAANTGRHVLELWQAAGLGTAFHIVCREVARHAQAHAQGKLEVRALLLDFAGSPLGAHPIQALSSLAPY